MSEKKRKRYEEKPDGRPSKKIASQGPSQNIKVSVIEDDDNWAPVLGECSLSLDGCDHTNNSIGFQLTIPSVYARP